MRTKAALIYKQTGKAVDKLDPNAGILEKGAAMVAGFEGGGMLGDFVKNKSSGGEAPQAESDPSQTDQSDNAHGDDQS
jgi:hypothetical protein